MFIMANFVDRTHKPHFSQYNIYIFTAGLSSCCVLFYSQLQAAIIIQIASQ